MKRFCSYLRADFKRLLCSAKPAVSVALTVAVLLLAVLEGIYLDAGVLYVFSLVMYGMPAMMILVCGALAYADSFCQDAEQKYMIQQIVRGDAGAYILARICSIFLSAMLTTALGIFLFANILHLRLAWVAASGMEQYEGLLRGGGLRIFLKSRRFELYFLCYGLQYGLLSGILSLWAAYLSLYLPNRMLVLAAPMILYYFTDYLLAGLFPGMINLGLIFCASNNLLSDDLFSVLFAAGIAAVNLGLLWVLMARKIGRTVRGSALPRQAERGHS